MAHFFYAYPIPTMPAYLFEADLASTIISPQTFTCVPTKDGQAYLHWAKHINTADPINDLYTEVYRSTDLSSWTLLTTLQWLNYDYLTDSTVSVGKTYYYKLRFVRKDSSDVVTNSSNYTVPLSARIVNALGFEPIDTYSNKFFKYLISSLPGTRVYDQTPGATFSATEQLWQTTSKILDGFNIRADGSVVHTSPADATALYAKRPVSFFLTKKQVSLLGTEASTGITGETVYVNSYLIYTFLMSYAFQFLNAYEQLLQIISNKFIDYSQIYTKGFQPVVSSSKNTTIADLYYSFGKLLGLKPLKSQSLDQGLDRYKEMLKSSFTNIDNLGKIKGVRQAGTDTLGITQQTILEYNKYHWFKSDREWKLYTIPSANDKIWMSTGIYGPNNDIDYTLADDKFSVSIEYATDISGIVGGGTGWLETLGSSIDSPYSYLFKVHMSGGVTTAADIVTLFNNNPVASNILTTAYSGLDDGLGVLYSGMDPSLVRLHTPWIGWEDSNLNLYGKKYRLKDTVSPLETGTDYCTMSRMISKKDPNHMFIPKPTAGLSYPLDALEVAELNKMETDSLPIVRDDMSEGVGYFVDETDPASQTVTLYGDKKVLFKISLTTSNMIWTTKALLKIFVVRSSDAGYLRLYRIRKRYDNNDVCWNFREKLSFSGYNLVDDAYVTDSTDWVVSDWKEAGALGASDAVFLKEFYVQKVDSPSWVTLDITDIFHDLHKYETSRLDMGQDEENVLHTGFMLVADGYPNKSLIMIKGHTDVSFKPKITWERLSRGFYRCDVPYETKYFYVDGTKRYGRLLVQQSSREPIHYIRTVNERISQQDIKRTSDITVVLTGTPPVGFAVGEKIYGVSSTAVGQISSIVENTLYVDMEIKNFSGGETVRLLSDSSVTAVVSSISYVGNKYVCLSRAPVSDSLIRVYHTGGVVAHTSAPAEYPAYSEWTEAGPGVEPAFITSPSGTINRFATRDSDDLSIIYLNSSDTVATIGDVIVTYQYEYDFILLGRTVTDADSIANIEGCNRLGSGLYSQTENDYLYRSELMLPMVSTGEYVDISGDALINEFSDYNMGILCDAVSNIRRYNGPIDVFKYQPHGHDYRFGQAYHTFLKRS